MDATLRFCDFYRDWLARRRLSMRQVHKAGEKMFVDFAGMRPSIVDPMTGEVIKVELFVAVLGASSNTYTEAIPDQTLPTWIHAHANALKFFGGSPEVFAPANLKSAVGKPCRYEPQIQRTYDEMTRHYGAVVIPARPSNRKTRRRSKSQYRSPSGGSLRLSVTRCSCRWRLSTGEFGSCWSSSSH